MTWDMDGNLYLTVGNNTGNVADKAQTDERPGRASWDDQRGSSNTNDLRGKILRIHPEQDGSYTIPEGNLFPKGTPNTRPEIYTMGHRNPWRPSVDSKTGWLYWGEVGPDATEDTKKVMAGMDELNQARKPGYFGWPYFIGENRATPYYDYAKDTVLGPKDPAKPINNSVNNTGLKELPPAQPAFISYPYGPTAKFPEVGTGSRCAVGGPIYHRSDFNGAARPFPGYYEGKWLAADLSRGWIMSISMDEKGDYKSMERFLPSYQPIEPIDIKFGPDGDLYVLEYGQNWFRKSDNSRIVRIEYNAGNRVPQVKASASATGGGIPFKVGLKGSGSTDPDGDALSYEWRVTPAKGGKEQVFKEADPSVTLTDAGAYTATLTVTDSKGEKSTTSLRVVAGNEAPTVDIAVAGNQTFFFPGKPVGYAVTVNDKEDGKADPARVAVSADYLSEGVAYHTPSQGAPNVDAHTKYAVAKAIIAGSDCNNCHHLDTRSVGPMFVEIADRYKDKQAWAMDSLPRKIRKGGVGVWGEVNMPAHPGVPLSDARTVVDYILHARDTKISGLPLAGSHKVDLLKEDNGKGTLVLRAAYTDRSAPQSDSLTTEAARVLKAPHLDPSKADTLANAELKKQMMMRFSVDVNTLDNGVIGFRHVDLSTIRKISVMASATPNNGMAGATIEIHAGSPTGELLGTGKVDVVDPMAMIMKLMGGPKDKDAAFAPPGGKAKGPGAGAPPAAAAGAKPAAAPAAAPKPGGAAPKGPSMDDIMKLLGPKYQDIAVKPVQGFQDLYFVFKNPGARKGQPLCSVTDIMVAQ